MAVKSIQSSEGNEKRSGAPPIVRLSAYGTSRVTAAGFVAADVTPVGAGSFALGFPPLGVTIGDGVELRALGANVAGGAALALADGSTTGLSDQRQLQGP